MCQASNYYYYIYRTCVYTMHMYMYVPGLYLGLSFGGGGNIDNSQIKGGMGVAKHFSCALHTHCCNNPTISFINPRNSTVYIVLHNNYVLCTQMYTYIEVYSHVEHEADSNSHVK